MPNGATFVSTTYGNSYISIGEADNYFDDQLFPEPWTTSDDATKEKALAMATRKIDSLVLIGRRVSPDQAQEFPRSIYNSGSWRWVDETEVADCVKDATCEEALSLLRNGIQAQKRAELQRMGVTSFSLGPLSETYSGASASGNKLLSVVAAQLLARYIGGSRTIS